MASLTTIAKFYDQEAKSGYDVGYSTSLCKAEEITQLLEEAGFSNIKIYGINFLGNFLEAFAGKLGLKISENTYYRFLKIDFWLNHFLPPQYARHMAVTGEKPMR